ncbi:MAG TPA: type II secretion system protein N [Gammaproteobacteria bacterium]
MKRWRWHILLFVAAYSGALLSALPASLVLHWAEPVLSRVQQRPVLHGVDGTVWSGHAAQAVYRGVTLGELKWELSPWALLIGRIDVDLKINGADGYLDSELSTGFGGRDLRLRHVSGQVPAAMLKSFAPSLPMTPAGTFTLAVDEVRFESAKLHGLDGRIVWNKGGVVSPLALEFGDLKAEFSSNEAGVTGRISDSGGPMQLSADLKLSADGGYTISGKSAARQGASPSLATSLSLLGQPDAQGMIPFRFTGRI